MNTSSKKGLVIGAMALMAASLGISVVPNAKAAIDSYTTINGAKGPASSQLKGSQIKSTQIKWKSTQLKGSQLKGSQLKSNQLKVNQQKV